MAKQVQKELQAWMEDIRSQIIQAQQSVSPEFWASGRSANSLQVGEFRSPRFDFSVPLLTTRGNRRSWFAYATMQAGRAGGLPRPPFDAITDWIEAKGISDPERTTEQLAFLISRAIGEQGSLVWQGARDGLDIAQILENNADKLANIVGDEMLRTLSTVIDENLPVTKTAVS